jgi:hypothetical protein
MLIDDSLDFTLIVGSILFFFLALLVCAVYWFLVRPRRERKRARMLALVDAPTEALANALMQPRDHAWVPHPVEPELRHCEKCDLWVTTIGTPPREWHIWCGSGRRGTAATEGDIPACQGTPSPTEWTVVATFRPSARNDDPSGPWTVWGDGPHPIQEGLDVYAMKSTVDRLVSGGRGDVYGSHIGTGAIYPDK